MALAESLAWLYSLWGYPEDWQSAVTKTTALASDLGVVIPPGEHGGPLAEFLAA